ncbi:hypothetical protein B0H14DRAFT_2584156 [Mycena olivaceomarginata]|nr:hypothetical protein B0H14DRAFT_2584156 [Mycena olivaceomarginata]
MSCNFDTYSSYSLAGTEIRVELWMGGPHPHRALIRPSARARGKKEWGVGLDCAGAYAGAKRGAGAKHGGGSKRGAGEGGWGNTRALGRQLHCYHYTKQVILGWEATPARWGRSAGCEGAGSGLDCAGAYAGAKRGAGAGVSEERARALGRHMGAGATRGRRGETQGAGVKRCACAGARRSTGCGQSACAEARRRGEARGAGRSEMRAAETRALGRSTGTGAKRGTGCRRAAGARCWGEARRGVRAKRGKRRSVKGRGARGRERVCWGEARRGVWAKRGKREAKQGVAWRAKREWRGAWVRTGSGAGAGAGAWAKARLRCEAGAWDEGEAWALG